MSHHENKSNAKKRFVQLQQGCILDSEKNNVHQFEFLDYKIDPDGRIVGEFLVDQKTNHTFPFNGFSGEVINRTKLEHNGNLYELERISVLHSNN